MKLNSFLIVFVLGIFASLFINCEGFQGHIAQEITQSQSSAVSIGKDYISEQEQFLLSDTKIGMLYFLWHCSAPQSSAFDISRILAHNLENPNWGPLGRFHWWARPKNGYYCLTKQPNVLREHLSRLIEAKIDFIIIDATNHAYTDHRSDRSRQMIMEPFRALVREWKKNPGAPKIVPWVPLLSDSDMINFFIEELDQNPDLYFHYKGKPLLLFTHNRRPVDADRFEEFKERFTPRKMWAYTRGSYWSFMERCQGDFLGSKGQARCNQPRVSDPDRPEMTEFLSITSAYQSSTMTNLKTAVPKFGGQTFRRQFQTLFEHPETKIAAITGWNEWIGYRFCPNYPHKVFNCSVEERANQFPQFVDLFNEDYNRDLEPGGKDGDFYFQLLKSCISIKKRGESCRDTGNANELCCSSQTAPSYSKSQKCEMNGQLFENGQHHNARCPSKGFEGGQWSGYCHTSGKWSYIRNNCRLNSNARLLKLKDGTAGNKTGHQLCQEKFGSSEGGTWNCLNVSSQGKSCRSTLSDGVVLTCEQTVAPACQWNGKSFEVGRHTSDCPTGYEGTMAGTCNSNGRWTQVDDQCSKKPTKPTCTWNGNGYQVGRHTSICPTGYEGTMTGTCNSNGSWSNIVDRCEKQCAKNGRYYSVGKKFSHSCRPGYSGAIVEECIEGGRWKRTDSCKTTTCRRDGKSFRQGTHTFRCSSGMTGSIERTCNGNGQWVAIKDNCTPQSILKTVKVYSAAPGRTGQWWCTQHFGANLGGTWRCKSVSGGTACSKDAPQNKIVTCEKL